VLPSAYVVHRSRGRLRLRVPEGRNDAAFFDRVRSMLEATPGEVEVTLNCGTGSILLVHPTVPAETVDAWIENNDVFAISDGAPPPVRALEPIFSGVSKLDRAITSLTDGRADLRTVLFVVAVILAIRQLARGNILGPAVPLMWMALELAGRIARSVAEDEQTD